MVILSSIYTALSRTVRTIRLVVIYGIRVDTNPVPETWTHITKVDPESNKKIPVAFSRYLSHTDAISVGGSADVTGENTVETFRLLEYISTPAFHEPSDPQHVTEESQSKSKFLAVPQVLNGDDKAFVGDFGAGVEYIREHMAPALLSNVPILSSDIKDRIAAVLTGFMLESAVTEAYIIQNPDSAAARESGVSQEDLVSPKEAKHRALAAEHVLRGEILYLEYSGTYGGEEAIALLEEIDSGVEWTRIWYGGGIDSREKTDAMLKAGANSVVVGDVFHRIATEEKEITEQYLNDTNSDSNSIPQIEVWMEKEIDVSKTAAAQYLSTIPSVSDPISTAQQYLCLGVRARCKIITEHNNSNKNAPASLRDTTVNAVADAIGEDIAEPEIFTQQIVGGILDEDQNQIPSNKFNINLTSA